MLMRKIRLQDKNIISHKRKHSIMIKGLMHQEHVKIAKVYALIKTFKMHEINSDRCIGEIGMLKIILEDFNTPLSDSKCGIKIIFKCLWHVQIDKQYYDHKTNLNKLQNY